MKKLLLASLLVFATRGVFAAEAFTTIHAADLNTMMKADKTVHVYDANNEDTRKTDGMIAGAQPLKSSSHYDVATLPTDKASKVVFYCKNTECMASHDAAKTAAKAGYKNVYVMADGIEGWKKAGMPTTTYTKAN